MIFTPTRRALLTGLTACAATAAHAAPDPGETLAAAARRQVGVTTQYDPAYRRIGYPGGDLPRITGVCADVIVRAGRDAWGADLQRLIHEDMGRAFSAYPHRWGLTAPDSNIDHRRVPNMETYWTRKGQRVWRADGPVGGASFPQPLKVGDLLVWRILGGGPHIGMVVEIGRWPRIVQNLGWGARNDPLLAMWPHAAAGQYRWRAARA
jgi:uncharacterized protein YijF (DUF1287 family)